jgi:hypothetical protein
MLEIEVTETRSEIASSKIARGTVKACTNHLFMEHVFNSRAFSELLESEATHKLFSSRATLIA